MIGNEFGIQNLSGSLNCFLNVVLQAFWVIPSLRSNLREFCELREGGPQEMAPLINSLQDFFLHILGQEEKDR